MDWATYARSNVAVPSIVGLSLIISCGGTDAAKGSKYVEGGGPLVPWKATAQLLSEDGSFVGGRVGEPTLLVVHDPDRDVRSTVLAAPGNGELCTGFPVALTTGDVNGDAREDILVLDPGCGNWLALSEPDGSHSPLPWSPTLPDVKPRHFLDYRDLNDDGLLDLVSATSSGAEFAMQSSDGWIISELTSGFPETHPMAATSLLIGPTPAGAVLFQRASLLDELTFPDGRVVRTTTLEQEELEFLRGFDGYDQLSLLSDPSCPDFAVGVGTFLEQPKVPRRLDILATTTTGYKAREVAVSGHQVFLATTVVSGSETFVGVVSADARQFYLDLLLHTRCDLEAITSRPISNLPGFKVAPATSDEALIHNAGERLLGTRRGSELRFQYYDGELLYIYKVSEDGQSFAESVISSSG